MDTLTPEQSDLYAQQYKPRLIVGVTVLHKDRSEGDYVVAVSELPRIGETMLNFRRSNDGAQDVLEVIDILHLTQELNAGETELPEKCFVDTTLICRQRSLSWHSDKQRLVRSEDL